MPATSRPIPSTTYPDRGRATAGHFEPLWRRTVRALRSHPAPCWKWTDIIRGRTHPAERIVDLCLSAARAGAPREDVLSVPREITRRVDAAYPKDVPSLPECVKVETELEGFENAAEVLALIAPSRSNLERARDRILAHERAEQLLLNRIDQELS